MQFLQSIWLWSAAAIAVPIAIHLWNVKQGKTLKVGSIALLTESAKSHAKSLKLSELLLLLLRCLLLVVLAMLIAKPFLEKPVDWEKEKGWLLIERNDLKEAYTKVRPTFDSLIKAGYTFHYFSPGFKKVQLEEALKSEHTPFEETSHSYWTLLRELDQVIPASLPAYLFSGNDLSRMKGSRPSVALNLNWSIYPLSDTSSEWIEKAYKTTSDSVKVIIGNSTSNGVFYTHKNLSYNTSTPDFEVTIDSGKTFVTSKRSTYTINTVQADTSTINITIYTDKFTEDANYVRAAVKAIEDFTKHKIKVTVANKVQAIPPNSSWLFWLSEEAVPNFLLSRNMFVYKKGKVKDVFSTVSCNNKTSEASATIYKTIENSNQIRNKSVWKDGYGNALLSIEKSTAPAYYFYSRFNPQWNDLVWNNQFPEMIYHLLFDNQKDVKNVSIDKRRIDPRQLKPHVVNPADLISKQSLHVKTELRIALWTIAFVVLLIERTISFRTKKKETHE